MTGDVSLGEDASAWFGVTIRGDDASIRIGPRTNVQDGAVIHVDPGCPCVIGSDVTIGHGAICHGVRIQDRALIGMGAILLSGSVIGEGAVVGAGTVVSEHMVVPPWTLAVGVPARIVRSLDVAERTAQADTIAQGYVARAQEHATDLWERRAQGSGPPS